MDYKDDGGVVLKGFSQVDLDELNKNVVRNNSLLRLQVVVFGLLFFVFLLVVIWVLWQVKKYSVVTHIINSLASC